MRVKSVIIAITDKTYYPTLRMNMSNLSHIPTGDSVGALPSDRSDPLLLLDYLRLQPCVHLLHVGHHEPPRPHEVRGLPVRPHLRHLQRYPRLHLRR